MKKGILLGILFIIATLMAVNVIAAPAGTCGGATPCGCDYELNVSRTLTAADNLTNCDNGLRMSTDGVTLDCDGFNITGDGDGTGIDVYGDDVTIIDCTISDFQTGINAMGVSGLSITGSTLHDNGVVVLDTSGVHLDGVDDSTISNNNISGNDYGVYMENSNDNTFEENIVNDNWYQAYYLSDSHNNTIDGGEVSSNNKDPFSQGGADGFGGVYLTGSTGNTIADLDMDDNTNGAIVMIFSSDNNIIEDNNIFDNCGLERQIFINDCYGTLIQNNDILNGTGHGIEIYDSVFARILNNNINGNGGAGVYITALGAEPVSDHVIRGNTINDNNNDGIRLNNEDNVTIDDNTIRRNNMGIYLSDSILNFITSNTVTDNTEDGLVMDRDSDDNTVNSNRFCDNLGGEDEDTDLVNYGSDNTGDGNTCDTATGWNDTGTTNCTRVCSWRPSTGGNGGSGDPPTEEIDLGGDTKKTGRGTTLQFDFGGGQYGLYIEGYGAHHEYLTIKIGRITYNIGLDETLDIDLDGDGEPDISVTYEGTDANTVPSEVSLKVEPYTESTTSTQPVALTLIEDKVTGEPIIVVKVVEKITEVVLEDIPSPVDMVLKKIDVNKVRTTLDEGRMAGGIMLLTITILGVFGLGYFIIKRK